MNSVKKRNVVWVALSCRQNSKQLIGFCLRFAKFAFCLTSVKKMLSPESMKKIE